MLGTRGGWSTIELLTLDFLIQCTGEVTNHIMHLQLTMSNSPVDLPSVIWRDVFVHWLGSLRDVARTDCAYRLTTLSNPLFVAYTEESFSCPARTSYISQRILVTLCTWLQERKVFIRQLELLERANKPLSSEWEHLISWSGERFQILTVDNSKIAISWASHHLRRLQRLTICDSIISDASVIENLLLNNASTLCSLEIHTDDDRTFRTLARSTTVYPCLKVLFCSVNCAHYLIRGCPNLVAFSVECRNDPSYDLLVAVAETCPLLRRLQLWRTWDISGDAMLQIAHCCPALDYLCLDECCGAFAVQFPDVVQAMPRLHTLQSLECTS